MYVSIFIFWSFEFNVYFTFIRLIVCDAITAWKMPKYGVFSGPYFLVFGLDIVFSPTAGKYRSEKTPTLFSVFNPNIGKCGPDKTPYFETFHAVPQYVKGYVQICGFLQIIFGKVRFGKQLRYWSKKKNANECFW